MRIGQAIATFLSMGLAVWATPSYADIGLDYYAPKASVSLVLTLTLKSCRPGPAGIVAAASASITSKAERDDDRRAHLDSASLRSLTKKRDVTIALTDDLTLKSINATVEDRTGAIFVSALKLAAGLVALAAAQGQEAVVAKPCNDATMQALANHDALVAALARTRAQLSTVVPEKVDALVKSIDSLATSIAALETGPLTLTLTKEIALDRDKMTSQPVRWTFTDLAKWFAVNRPGERCQAADQTLFAAEVGKSPCAFSSTLFSAQYSVTDNETRFTPGKTDVSCFGTSGDARPECRAGIVLVTPANAVIKVFSTSSNIDGKGSGDPLGQSDLVVPQWGRTEIIPFKAGFAETRMLALTFDSFSRITQFQSKTDARLENALGAANDALTQVSSIHTTLAGAQVAKWKADIDELQTEQKWNALNTCRAAIEAGATTCPAAPAASQ